jgi:DeoR/GlpR family transcriptional regulator of sugar metabolism
MLGGILRHVSHSLVGPPAEQALRALSADRAFVGADGVDLDIGLSTPDILEAQLGSLMIAAAREVVVVADSTKFGRRSLSVIAGLQPGMTIVTDQGIPDETQKALEARDVRVVIA